MSDLTSFVRESNRIEGITREPSGAEIETLEAFVKLPALIVADVRAFVEVYQPGAVIRNHPSLNVRVGDHVAPRGGPEIVHELALLLDRCNKHRGVVQGPNGAWAIHHEYEHLHPFTDGNGRSGRAVWLWQMRGHAPLGFLHHWYYLSLSERRREALLGKRTAP